MPTQVAHPRPSQHSSDQFATDQAPHAAHPHHAGHAATKQQQQLQHREALRLALGSILTPKRPPLGASSRSSSGTASPAYHFGSAAGVHSASGTHTPVGTPPAAPYPYSYSQAYGPNSSEHLHPHAHAHGHGHHPHPPSRLRPTSHSPPSSGNPSPTSSLPSTRAPSSMSTPHLGGTTDTSIAALPDPSDIELLPPAGPRQDTSSSSSASASPHVLASSGKPTRPPIRPLQATREGVAQAQLAAAGPVNERPVVGAAQNQGASAPVSGCGTPKSKFLQTLQSKSAWDALIHGSFS